MATIKNPILRGFHPDPSICKVNDTYYIATSTFEWFPGVCIHSSKNLSDWTLVGYPLDSKELLDMHGIPDSCGIWAPCLSYSDGMFYLIYTIVKNKSVIKDTPNYLTTAPSINGPWSNPVYLNSSGFDPSLFHDTDGKKWLINMRWDTQYDKHPFDGILLQEYDVKEKKLVGPIKNIFKGSSIGGTEGPHIYKINEYYYLFVAEGGTGYNHAVTVARSKNLDGPYEIHPSNPILTSKGTDKNTVLQKAGHASIANYKDNIYVLAHLCSRPLKNTTSCVLGRETALQKIKFKNDNWPYLVNGSNKPSSEVSFDNINNNSSCKAISEFHDFSKNTLSKVFMSLRIPYTSFISMTANKNALRIYGKESMLSCFNSSLIARRQQSFSYIATTKLTYKPNHSQHMAGLICYYDTNNFHYLRISRSDNGKKIIGVISIIHGEYNNSMTPTEQIVIKENCPIYLKAEVSFDSLYFSFSYDDCEYRRINREYSMHHLSDDDVKGHAFTGAFVGICCQDLDMQTTYADFYNFTYKESL